jgi:hypothetical protein
MGNNIQTENDIIERVANVLINDTSEESADFESFITSARLDVIGMLTDTNDFKNLTYIKRQTIIQYLTYQQFGELPPDEIVIYRSKILADYKKKEEEKTNSLTYKVITIVDGRPIINLATEFYQIYAHPAYNNALVFTCDRLRNCKCKYENGVFIC